MDKGPIDISPPQVPKQIMTEQVLRDERDVSLEATLYAGPLPPPALLAKFEEIQPGLVERIVGMAEKQAAHRQSIELKRVEAVVNDQKAARNESRLGQIFGFLIGIVAILAGTYAAVNGSQWPGSIIGGGGVVALVSVFVLGRRSSKDGEQDTDSPGTPSNSANRTRKGGSLTKKSSAGRNQNSD